MKNVRLTFSMKEVRAEENELGNKIIARSDDGRRLAQLAPNFLAVNCLQPYHGWEEEFRGRILDRFNECHSLFGFRGLQRVGLRYINLIIIPDPAPVWTEWFSVPLPIPAAMPADGGKFRFNYHAPLSEQIECLLNFGVQNVTGSETYVLLDIDVIWTGKEDVGLLRSLLERVHDPHREIFEGYLLDKTRDLFKNPTSG